MSAGDAEMSAVIELFRPLKRQGPGDAEFSRKMLKLLPQLAEPENIADLGCGTGAGTFLLAEHFRTPVRAVDACGEFISELNTRARALGLQSLIRAETGDFTALGWDEERLDLLWSEGAAYHLTFAGALQAWRSLLKRGGLAVISEASWFTADRPEELRAFWSAAYPSMGDEAENVGHAESAGFEVLSVHCLPTQAWWDNYYEPLQKRIDEVAPQAGDVMRRVIEECRAEIELFRKYSDAYGYTYYLLRAV